MVTVFEKRARRFVVAIINWYQRHLSPHKGFRCAYGVLHGGDSCSQAIKHRVLDGGVRGLWKDARRQFALCHDAHRTLRRNASQGNDLQRNAFAQNQGDKPFSDDTPFDEASSDSTAPDSTAPDSTAPDSTAPDSTAPDSTSMQGRRRRNPNRQNPNGKKGDCQPNCCDAIHCADGCGSLSSCRGAGWGRNAAIADCGALDCSALECGVCACPW